MKAPIFVCEKTLLNALSEKDATITGYYITGEDESCR
jgi:hypothetical protein